MVHCHCGYVIESDEFKYCPKCGDEVSRAESVDECVTPDNLTVPRLKRIIERSEQPVRLRVDMAVDEEFEETSPENARTLVIHGINPIDGQAFQLGTFGSVVCVGPNWEKDTDLFEEASAAIVIFAIIGVKRPAFLEGFYWLDVVTKLNESSRLGNFAHDQTDSRVTCRYEFPLFGAITEEGVQKMLQLVYLDMMATFAPFWDRVQS